MAPGVALCLALALAACLVEQAERVLLGKAWLEALVLAIVGGAAVRGLWAPGERWQAGIAFSAKYLLEIAVVLLGASVSGAMIAAAGVGMLLGIAAVVGLAILASFGLGRMLGLPVRMALLVACGNSICGNSAIAAVAPVIGAEGGDVAAAIGFTAVLGVGMVLGLPVLGAAMGMHGLAFGAFAGLTVYAVPQVMVATAPFGPLAVQMGTLVKLVRVLMLGPVCLILSLLAPVLPPREDGMGPCQHARRPAPGQIVPWFIIGFGLLVGGRSLGVVPTVIVAPMAQAAGYLTVVSMAALGLGVDMRVVGRAGARVTVAVVASLLVLGGISFALLGLLHLA